MCQKFEQKTSTNEELIMSPSGMDILETAISLPSNSGEVFDKNMQTKYTFQELNFNLFHNQDNLNADTCRRQQYQTHEDKFETSAHNMTETGESVRQNSRRCHQNPQKYETKCILKENYLLGPENEENQSPQHLNHNELYANHQQNQLTEHFRVQSVPFQNNAGAHSEAGEDVDSFNNVNDAIMLQEEGSGSRQQMTVDDIKSMPLSQGDGSGDDLFVAAEAFDHKTADAEGRLLQHTQLPAAPHGLGEFVRDRS
jgi:hypothetical protein